MQTSLAPPQSGGRYRSIPETQIIDMLLLSGWAFECAAGHEAKARAQCAASLENFLARGLGFTAGQVGERRFDPVEVLNVITAEGLAGTSPLWEEQFITTGRALYHSLPPAPRHFEVAFTRTLNFETEAAHACRPRVTIPIPIACAYVEHPTATLVLPPGLDAEFTLRKTCFDIRLKTPPSSPLSCTARFTFTAPGRPGVQNPLTEADRLLYLRPAENFIRITPRIRRSAAALAAGTPEKTVAAIWNFLLDHVCLCMIQYADIPPDAPGDWVLEHRWCDCLLAASLFISCCRAESIPARLIGGHVLYRHAPTNHFWAECWLGNAWVPYDFLAWDFSAAGRDPAWRDIFAGQCDARMVTAIFPTHFTGPMTLRLPVAWHIVQTRAGEGICCAYHDAATGALIYCDHITLTTSSGPDRPPGEPI